MAAQPDGRFISSTRSSLRGRLRPSNGASGWHHAIPTACNGGLLCPMRWTLKCAPFPPRSRFEQHSGYTASLADVDGPQREGLPCGRGAECLRDEPCERPRASQFSRIRRGKHQASGSQYAERRLYERRVVLQSLPRFHSPAAIARRESGRIEDNEI